MADHRVIALIDMDCFYVQVEQRLQREFLGKPCGVAQYYTWKGGGLIAVNYEARDFGVKRGMRGEQAKELCPDFHVFHVQEVNGKANLTRYRDASADVFRVLNANFKMVEKASIDEAYLDLTDDVQMLKEQKHQLTLEDLPSTHLAGSTIKTDDERLETVGKWLNDCQPDEERNFDLALGAYLVEQIRQKIKQETGFFCSAGIARNKILAKLCCGFNKPKKQTIFTHSDVDIVFDRTPVQKIQGLGGKAGERVMELFQVQHMGELRKYSLDALQTSMGEKDGCWLFNLVRGIEMTPVNSRNLCKSISASKNFPGQTRLDTTEKVRVWCHHLAEEIFNRLEKDRLENKRRAKLLTVTCTLVTSETIARSCSLSDYSIERFANDAYRILKQFNKNSTTSDLFTPALINLGLSAGKFVDSINSKSIADMFFKQTAKTEMTTATGTVIDWPDEDASSDSEETVIEKVTTRVPVQGEFFQKFQKNDDQNKSRSVAESKPTSSIVSFFSRYTPNESSMMASPSPRVSTENDSELSTICPRCNKSILAWNMAEHEDFHFARELQLEEDKNTRQQPVTTAPIKAIKRKNDSKQSTINTNQTLDGFLSKKPKL